MIEVFVSQNEARIVNWNAEGQLYNQGENRLGISIDTYAPYTPYTKAIKKEKGQPYDRVTLNDTGDFEGSLYIEFQADGFRIYAADSKTDELTDKYGSEILGLSDENLERLIAEFRPFLMERAESELLERKK